MTAHGAEFAGPLAKISETLADLLVKYRLLLIIIFTGITLYLGYHASFLRMDPGFDKSIPMDHEYMETYREYKDDFGGANTIIIALMQKEGTIFNPSFFKALEKATFEVLFINGVDRPSVTSLFTPNVNFIGVNEKGFYGARVVSADFLPNEEAIAGVRQNLLRSQEIGRLVTRDFKGALIKATLVDRDPETGEKLDYAAVAQQLEEIRSKYSNENVDIHIIGFSKFITDVIDGAEDVLLFFLIAMIITAVMLYFYSSSLQITVLTLIVSLMAVVWQLGLVKLLGYGIDPLSILVPFLILSIGVSHAVQMTNTWKLEVLKGADSVDAAHISFNKLFIPGATALLSDAVGFAVIMLIDIDIIHELGITASIGVAVMLITNKFLLPSLLSYARLRPKTIAKIRDSVLAEEKPIWRFFSRFASRKTSVWVIVISIGAGFIGYYKAQDMVIGDTEAGAPEFYPDSTYNQDIDVIINNFNIGIDEITVIVETPPQGCINWEAMDSIDRFVWDMTNLPDVQSVTSLSSIIKGRTVGNNEGHYKFYSLPRDTYALGSAMRGMELSSKVFNSQCDAIPIRIFARDHKAETMDNITKAVKEFQAENGTEQVNFRLASGGAGVMAATNEAIERAELQMNLTLFSAVGLFVFLTFFSLRAALCIVIPLALVAFLGNAVMAWLNIGMKVSTLPVIALGVGIGVDYGIYLFARTYAYLGQGKDLVEAYYQGLKEAGTAVVFTALTMTIGVSTWAFATLKFQADMGILLAYMFFMNMIGAVILLPGLAAWLIKKKPGT